MRKIPVFISSIILLMIPFKAVKAQSEKDVVKLACDEIDKDELKDVLRNLNIEEYSNLSNEDRQILIKKLLEENECFDFDDETYFQSEEYLNEMGTFSFKS